MSRIDFPLLTYLQRQVFSGPFSETCLAFSFFLFLSSSVFMLFFFLHLKMQCILKRQKLMGLLICMLWALL